MKKLIAYVCIALVLIWTVGSYIEVVLFCDTDRAYHGNNLVGILLGEHTEHGIYVDGNVYTDDGHIWGYDTDLADGTRVRVNIDTNDTDDTDDDVITRLSESK